jgi:hypothetical protein
MAYEIINIGAAPNDGTGDPLRTAFTKINSNFSTINENSISANLIPATDNVYSLGSTSQRWKSVHVGPGSLYIQDTSNVSLNAELTVTNGVLQVNGANQLQVGQLKFVDNTIESTTGNINIQLGLTSSSGDLVINRNVLLAAGKTITRDHTYGCFHKLANITAPAASTVYSFDWYANTTAHVGSEGVTVNSAAPTDIHIATAGSYNVTIEMHVRSTVNAIRTAYLWLATNNVDMAESCIKAEIKQGASGDAQQIITKTWLVKDVQSNDYITLRFAVDDQTGISLEYTPAIVTPYVRPAIPSATISITPIG